MASKVVLSLAFRLFLCSHIITKSRTDTLNIIIFLIRFFYVESRLGWGEGGGLGGIPLFENNNNHTYTFI